MSADAAITDSAACLPILIGITGKRCFAKLDSDNQALLDIFAARLHQTLTWIDKMVPQPPKILLCGGASGVDVVAAETVLRHFPTWSVIIMLPLEMALFAEDFDGDADGLQRLQALIGQGDRITVKHLRRLHVEKFDDSRLEPDQAPRLTDAVLSRSAAGYDPVARRRHYEQLGLWLARHATLLIAGLIATQADPLKLGGTGRVMAFRRTGLPDPEADFVIQRSSELQSCSELEEPDGAAVLLIDPTEADRKSSTGLPFEALRPLQDLLNIRTRTTNHETMRQTIYKHPAQDIIDPNGPGWAQIQAVIVRRALELPRAFAALQLHQKPATPSDPSHAADAPAAALLESVRVGPLATQGDDASNTARRNLRRIVAVFFAALAIYEIHVELISDTPWMLLLYALLIGATFAIAMQGAAARTQILAEDIRGLREMMRVQIGWWNAGIDRRVDRCHLRSIDSDLRLIREVAATVSLWAVLRCRRREDCDAVAGTDPASGCNGAREWVTKQVDYYADRSREHFGCERLAELVFSITLLAALICVTALGGGLLVWHDATTIAPSLRLAALLAFPVLSLALSALLLWLTTMRPYWSKRAAPGGASLLAALAGLGLMAVQALILHGTIGQLPTEWAGAMLRWLGPLIWLGSLVNIVARRLPTTAKLLSVPHLGRLRIAGSALVVGLAMLDVALVFAAPLTSVMDEAEATEIRGFRAVTLVLTTLVLAVAGLARFYSERRNHTAQARQYDDMLRAFRRAENLLPAEDAPFDRHTRGLLIELGELALDESEAWLKAHRERPPAPPG